MKYLLVTLLAVVFQFHVHSQETTRITVKDKSTNSKEVYYVLKSDQSTQHGPYQKIIDNKFLIVEGHFKQGLKDSLWTYYKHNGKGIISSGKYLENMRVGIWSFYDYKGKLEQNYDFSENKVVYFKTEKEELDRKYKIINGLDTLESSLDNPPLYIGGASKMKNQIAKNIHYPVEAMENGIQGTVNVIFTIDSNGVARNHRVSEKIGFGCDEEAIRVVKLIPNNWYPAQLNGKRVNVEFSIPINFVLN